MQLTVPQRNVADTQSFPVDPEAVSHWLADLQPVDNSSHAWEVYRGLKHSNRLHNDVSRRRQVISCFIPVLREMHASLSDLCRAQPLPLTREFRRSAKLLDGLLREEAFAFKLLLADSNQPLADDIRRAMMALSRQADAIISGYQLLPPQLLRDANQLYQLAEHHQLLDISADNQNDAAIHHYFYIQYLAILNLQQVRARQMPLMLKFLRETSVIADKLAHEIPTNIAPGDWGLHLHLGAKPSRARYLLQASDNQARWFSTASLRSTINQQHSKIHSTRFSSPGADTLEKQTLARVKAALEQARSRRSQRRITNQERNTTLGHKAICAHLRFKDPLQPQSTTLAMQQTNNAAWCEANVSAQGCLLEHKSCSPGIAQVGELVCVNDQVDPTPAKARVGIVRWMCQTRDVEVSLGVEYIARGVLPVSVVRSDSRGVSKTEIADDGIIVACKIKGKTVQTLLLPAYLYQTGDIIVATQNDQSRTLQLIQSLQNNGLFSHFSLAQVTS